MGRSLLRDETGGVFQFPGAERRAAFRAAELIRDRLTLEISVSRRRDLETGERVWALEIFTPGRELEDAETKLALETCRLACDD